MADGRVRDQSLKYQRTGNVIPFYWHRSSYNQVYSYNGDGVCRQVHYPMAETGSLK